MFQPLERMGDYIKTLGDLVLLKEIGSLQFPLDVDVKEANKWIEDAGMKVVEIKKNEENIQFIINAHQPKDVIKKRTVEIRDGIKATYYKVKAKEESKMPKAVEPKLKRFVMHAELKMVPKLANDASEDFFIEGLASTGEIDRDLDIVSPKAFEKALDIYMENAVICYMHDWDKPIGVATFTKILKPGEAYNGVKAPTGGLYIRAYISKSEPEIRTKIKEGVLKAFSIGFQTKDADYDDEKEVQTIKELELFEVSVVTIPSNRRSLFSLSKALKTGTDLVCVECADENNHEHKDSCCARVVEPEVDEKFARFRDKVSAYRKKHKKEDKVEDYELYLKNMKKVVGIEELVDEEAIELEKQMVEDIDSIRLKDGEIVKKSAYVDRFLKLASHEYKELNNSYGFFELSLYAKALNVICNTAPWNLVKIFNVNYWGDKLARPQYAYLELGRDKKEELLIEGYMLLTNDKQEKIAIHLYQGMYGFYINAFYAAEQTDTVKQFFDALDKWVDDNNFYKGECINYRGQFLPISNTLLEEVKMKAEQRKAIKVGIFEFFAKKEFYKKHNIELKRGLIFSGEPGTGKTMTGKAIFADLKCTRIWITQSDMGYGSDAKGIFGMARKLAPCILFAEDVDDFVSSPHSVDSLKTEMDGLKSNEGVITVLCTNFPDKIPAALIDRPGRFDDIIKFELPDETTRFEILSEHSKTIDIINKEEMLKKVAKETEGFAGAHLKEVIIYSLMLALDENREVIEEKDLDRAIEKMKKTKETILSLKEKKAFKAEVEIKSVSTFKTYAEKKSARKEIKKPTLEVGEKTFKIPQDIFEEIVMLATQKDEPETEKLLGIVEYLEDLIDKGSKYAEDKYYLKLLQKEVENVIKQDEEALKKRFEKVLSEIKL